MQHWSVGSNKVIKPVAWEWNTLIPFTVVITNQCDYCLSIHIYWEFFSFLRGHRTRPAILETCMKAHNKEQRKKENQWGNSLCFCQIIQMDALKVLLGAKSHKCHKIYSSIASWSLCVAANFSPLSFQLDQCLKSSHRLKFYHCHFVMFVSSCKRGNCKGKLEFFSRPQTIPVSWSSWKVLWTPFWFLFVQFEEVSQMKCCVGWMRVHVCTSANWGTLSANVEAAMPRASMPARRWHRVSDFCPAQVPSWHNKH